MQKTYLAVLLMGKQHNQCHERTFNCHNNMYLNRIFSLSIMLGGLECDVYMGFNIINSFIIIGNKMQKYLPY